MPTASSTPRSLGRSTTAWEARASMAMRPPSPSLSARSTNTTYLIVTIRVSAQTISESTPRISMRRAGPLPDAACRASRKA